MAEEYKAEAEDEAESCSCDCLCDLCSSAGTVFQHSDSADHQQCENAGGFYGFLSEDCGRLGKWTECQFSVRSTP